MTGRMIMETVFLLTFVIEIAINIQKIYVRMSGSTTYVWLNN